MYIYALKTSTVAVCTRQLIPLKTLFKPSNVLTNRLLPFSVQFCYDI